MTKQFKYSYPKIDHLFLGMDLAYTTARTGLCGLGLKGDRLLLVSAPIIEPLSEFRGELENGVTAWVNGLMKKYRCNRATLALGHLDWAGIPLMHALRSELGFRFHKDGEACETRCLIAVDPQSRLTAWHVENVACVDYHEGRFRGGSEVVLKTIARFNPFFGEFPIFWAEFKTASHFDSYVRALAAFEDFKTKGPIS